MGDRQDFTRQVGYRALCIHFGIQERPGGGRGPFSGRHHRPKGGPRPVIMEDPDHTAGVSATRIHATETRNALGSKPLLLDSQRLTGYMRQYIAELEPMEQLWVNFCYRDSCHLRSECWTKFLHKYTQAYIALNCQGVREETKAVIREMIAWRMGQEAGEIPWGAKFESANGSIKRQAWHKTYKAHWNSICEDLARVDQAALYKIGVKVLLH